MKGDSGDQQIATHADADADGLLMVAKRAYRMRRAAMGVAWACAYALSWVLGWRVPASTVQLGMVQFLLFVAPVIIVQILCVLHGARKTGRLRKSLFAAAEADDVRVIPMLIECYFDASGESASEAGTLLVRLLTALGDRPDESDGMRFRRPIRLLLPARPRALPVSDDREPLILAALGALKQMGGRADLPILRTLAAWDSNASLARKMREAAHTAIEERLARQAAGATLLRPAEPGGDVLLRPAEDAPSQEPGTLLRASEAEPVEQRNEVRR